MRELAKRIGVSSPFLSDIELGRRFPSEEVLGKLAAALNVSLEELKQHDNRGPIADLKRLMDSDPKLGFAFRTAVEKVKSGELHRCLTWPRSAVHSGDSRKKRTSTVTSSAFGTLESPNWMSGTAPCHAP